MGILPIVFAKGESAASLGLSGFEHFDVLGLHDALETGAPVRIHAETPGHTMDFEGRLDLASDHEAAILRGGGLFATLLDGHQEKEQQDAG